MTTLTAQTTQVYSVFIRATPEQVWDAITQPEWTARYFYGARIEVGPSEMPRFLENGASSKVAEALKKLGAVPTEFAFESRGLQTWRSHASGARHLAASH